MRSPGEFPLSGCNSIRYAQLGRICQDRVYAFKPKSEVIVLLPRMKLTTRGHYSVKALLDLALQRGIGPTSVNAIAQRQNIPAPYLEKLLIEMRRAGLVESVRGAQGGYQLAKSAAQISLGQILEAVGETIEPLPRHQADIEQAEDWVTYTLWNRLHHKLKEALYGISLEDLYYDARSWQAALGEETSFVV